MTRRWLRWLTVALLLGCGLLLPSSAQEPAAPPVLSEVTKLKIQNAALNAEKWQAKLEQAQTELRLAQAAFTAIVKDSTPAGYAIQQDLTLQPVKIP